MALYDNVLSLCKNYFGPGAEKFITRQITVHLNMESPEHLSEQHLEELAKWCFISGKLMIAEADAQELSERIKALKK